jgi:hypothetical protein
MHIPKINARDLRKKYLKAFTKQTLPKATILLYFCLNVTLSRAIHNEYSIPTD